MKRKLRSLTLLPALLLIAVLMTGCLGGSGERALSEKQIREFLDEVEDALEKMDEKQVANLCKYPLIFKGTEISKKNMEARLLLEFDKMKEDDINIAQVKYLVKNSDIVLDAAGKSATIAQAEVFLVLKQDDETLSEETINIGSFELIKSGLKWKFHNFDSTFKWLFESWQES